MSAVKKIVLELTADQYAAYEAAATKIAEHGLPIAADAVVRMMVAGKDEGAIVKDFWRIVKQLGSKAQNK